MSSPSLSTPIRIAALIVGVSASLATFVLTAVSDPIPPSGDSFLGIFWELLRYFTILTNFIVSYVLIIGAVKGRWHNFSLLTAATMWIVIVGVIYHAMLAAVHNPTGIGAITNQVHHTFVPIGTCLIWLFTKFREPISSRAPFVWLIFPLFYTAYMLTRGAIDGIYPYHFSDPTLIGWSGFTINQLVLSLFFLGLGFGFRWISNWLGRRTE